MRRQNRLHAHWEATGVMGARLYEARLTAGMSQSELARRTGTSQTLISDYERGEKEPSYPMVVRLLSGMGMAADVRVRPRGDDERHDERLEIVAPSAERDAG